MLTVVMTIRRTAGGVLVAVGVLGITACLVLTLYGAVAVHEMSQEKAVSDGLSLALIAAWWAGFVVAGRVLRRP